jgi:hypothetical protein
MMNAIPVKTRTKTDVGKKRLRAIAHPITRVSYSADAGFGAESVL